MTARQVDSRSRGDDDEDGEGAVPPWVAHFLAGLIVTGSVKEAVADAGIDFDMAWTLRDLEPAFAIYWDRAIRVHKGVMAGLSVPDAVAEDEASIH